MTKHAKRILLGLCIGLFSLIVYLTPQGWALEEKYGLYWLFHLRGTTAAPEEVIVIAADRPSALQMGLPVSPRFWPWPRDYHARLIDQLAQAGAEIIVLDLIFDSPGAIPEHDQQLIEAIEKAGNVVTVERLSAAPLENADTQQLHIIQHRRIPPLPEIAAATLSHTPFPLPRMPRINAYWAFKPGIGDSPTMPVVALQAYTLRVYDDFIALLKEIDQFNMTGLPASRMGINDLESVMLRLREQFANNPEIKQKLFSALRHNNAFDNNTKQNIRILTHLYSGKALHYLNFYGPPRTIQTIPYHQILQPTETNTNISQSVLQAIEGKAVFVGLSAATQSEQDIIRDSYHTVFTEPEGRQIDGVEIAATAFANLYENRPLKPFSYSGSLGLLFISGLMLGFVFPLLSNRKILAVSTILAAAYTTFAWLLFSQASIWMPLIIPLFIVLPCAIFGATLLKHLETRKERDQLLELFGEFSPERVVDDFTRHADASLLKDKVVFGACLFTDAEGYTPLSEKMEVRQLRSLMDDYFSVLTQSVRQNNGIVTEKIGDAILAIWEVTTVDKILRIQACEAGLAIINNVNQFNQTNNHPALPTRVGIHFGELLISKFGTIDNYILRVVGDLVNTTSRIESANKPLGTYLLVSNDVVEGIDRFLTRPVGRFLFPGKSVPINLSELITHRKKASKRQLKLCNMFAQGLEAYSMNRQQEALEKFIEILEIFPEDGPSQFYRTICSQPPAIPWKPVIQLSK